MAITADLPTDRRTKRGFVMTGGGAKGLYEAGAIQAFHLCGMEFDVITGSSIGAINAILYAEYLLRKREQSTGAGRPDLDKASPEAHVAQVDAMDDFIRRFHRAWLRLPELNIIDDTEGTSKLGRLKDDLTRFYLQLPDIVRVTWWLSDPERSRRRIPPLRVLVSGARLLWEVIFRLGSWRQSLEMIRLLFREPRSFLDQYLPAYLRRFDMHTAIVEPAKAEELEAFFTQPFEPLQPEHLEGGEPEGVGQEQTIMDLARTMADYRRQGIDVRLTRANFRTGRLEISGSISPQEFAVYLTRQAWRLFLAPDEGFPLGSHRVQVPGNPRTVPAAIASGRFPGVFSPYPLARIYPQDDPQNRLLYRLLSGWLKDDEVQRELAGAYQAFIQDRPDRAQLQSRWQIDSWQENPRLQQHFPVIGDAYVDGGAIDNTPTNSAIDTIREWAYLHAFPRNQLALDLYVLLLHEEPLLSPMEAESPSLYRVVRRTLEIQSAAKLTADSNTASTINRFGAYGEQLGEALRIVLEAADGLDEAAKERLAQAVRHAATKYETLRTGGRPRPGRKPAPFAALLGGEPEDTFANLDAWSRKVLEEDLPLQVNTVQIHPDKMSMDTLQFTERLGYRQDNAVQMITMGCYNTLWDVRDHLEAKLHRDDGLDEHDQRALALVRRWTGVEEWPSLSQAERRDELRRSWQCQRIECVFHANHCAHGVGG